MQRNRQLNYKFVKKKSCKLETLAFSMDIMNKKTLQISLAEFSLAQSLYNSRLNHLDFPAKAKHDFGIHAVEYVSGFWNKKANDPVYLKELKQRTDDLGIQNVLIMVDAEGELGASNKNERNQAIENHYKWIEAAKYLGCFAIRANIDGEGSDKEIMNAAVDGYGRLLEFSSKENIHVIIENHMTVSTNPDWLVELMKQVNHPYAGCLPDFGNFTRRKMPKEWSPETYKNAPVTAVYDKYEGVKKMMPYAKGISAKTILFDREGNCTDTDFSRMIPVVKKGITPAFFGYIGIEYGGYFMKKIDDPGKYLDEEDAIWATKKLLEKTLL
ncbi:MAG: TIM barrel protein [Bacteroidetes bacterium]|nr:TIM barrel protein [Bacteroidota bacterium]